MTILNIHIDDEDKEKVKELSEIEREKSMSEYVRKVLAEKIKIQEIQEGEKQIDEIKIPDYIPKNKYVGFVKGAIIGVADSPNEIAQMAVDKFPNDPLIIKYNGAKKKQIEYSYLNLTELNCWKYAQIEETSYPIFPMIIKTKLEEKKLATSIDTASSLCVLKEDIYPRKDFKISREERIATASGIVKSKIYKGKIELTGSEFDTEFILSPIPNSLPFSFLIGRNIMDKLDTYLLGKKQIICLKIAE